MTVLQVQLWLLIRILSHHMECLREQVFIIIIMRDSRGITLANIDKAVIIWDLVFLCVCNLIFLKVRKFVHENVSLLGQKIHK